MIQLNRTYLKKTHVKTHRYMVTQTYLLRDPEDLAENSHLKKTRFSTKRLKLEEGESEKMSNYSYISCESFGRILIRLPVKVALTIEVCFKITVLFN